MPRDAPERRTGRSLLYAASWHRRPPSPWLHIDVLADRFPMPPGIHASARGPRHWRLMQFHTPVAFAVQGRPERMLPAGSVVMWSPQRHPAWYGNRQQPWSHSWIVCSGTACAELLRKSGLEELEPLAPPLPGGLTPCIHALHEELLAPGGADADILTWSLAIAIRQLRRAQAADGTGAADARLAWARSHLERTLDRQVSLGELATQQKMSPRHLARLFLATWGLSPAAYHLRVRMIHAAGMLRQPGTSVATVAAALGYANAFAFTKAFTRWYGTPPSRYRPSGR
jgi:AraC-like DNA-binding protein